MKTLTNEQVKQRFGRNVEKKRRAGDMTVADLASKSGTSASAICTIQKGEREIGIGLACRIAQVLGCTVDDLLQPVRGRS